MSLDVMTKDISAYSRNFRHFLDMEDLTRENLGCTLPSELAHLSAWSKYAKLIKEDVYGFFIPQFFEDGTPNIDWYTFRPNTIGASEIAVLLDMDEYGDPVKLFWQKLGDDFGRIDSIFTYWGLTLEEKIAAAWEYFDGTEDGYVHNKMSGVKIRQKVDIPCYAINVNYPWLSASLDFLVPAGQAEPFDGEVVNFSFPLEIKNISPFAAEKYELGIPRRYVIQLHQQMIVWGCDYAEIAFLTSGHLFKVLPFNMEVAICQDILIKSREFWNRVEEGRKTYVPGITNDPNVLQEVAKLEPEPSPNKSYMEFYKEKYKNSIVDSSRLGTEEEWDLCVEYKTIDSQISTLSKQKEAIKNKIYQFSKFDEEVSFGENGRVVNRRSADKRSYFGVNIKNY